MRLNAFSLGHENMPKVVFLHGFAGDLTGWGNLQVGLSTRFHTIAFDLPGHGGSLGYPKRCDAVVAAKAVIAELDEMGIAKAHLVGHSMGGAAAALIGLRRPDLVASLSLLAPGGFGPQINQALLRNYARAREVDTILMLLEQFFGSAFEVPRALAEQSAAYREKDGAIDALMATAEAILDGKVQKVLPLDALGELGVPIRVLWGEQDHILPVAHCQGLPGMMGVHRFEDVGHMVHFEAPREVLALVRQVIQSA